MVATNGILKFCLRGMLGKKQRKTVYLLFDTLSCICADAVDMDLVDELEQQVH